MSSKNSDARQSLAPDDAVITPSGRPARIVAVFSIVNEATVQWQDGERGRFKVMNLRPAEKETT